MQIVEIRDSLNVATNKLYVIKKALDAFAMDSDDGTSSGMYEMIGEIIDIIKKAESALDTVN